MINSDGSNTIINATGNSQSSSVIMPDYKKIDYRGFVFVIHNSHGMLLLHCTRKPKKGPHYQLPGGHVDDFEFEAAAKQYYDKEEGHENISSSSSSTVVTSNKILLDAARMGAARELFEETGIDVREQLNRLEPVRLYKDSDDTTSLVNMLQNKLYFFLNVTNDDFLLTGEDGLTYPQGENGKDLALRISHEHSGFIFENDPLESIEKLFKHSSGTGARALRMSMHPAARLGGQRAPASAPSPASSDAAVAADADIIRPPMDDDFGNTMEQNDTTMPVQPILLPSPRPKRHGVCHGIFSCCSFECC
mmetsp:Transcript_2427/g.4518  ORF Transcript_2427/g.4518 Transcript_2427/m.4518 type:complete len:306 (-) Transcript_2427:216-1133(-)